MPKPPSSGNRRPFFRKQRRYNEKEEIALLDSWIEAMKPSPGTNPLSVPPPPPSAPVGKLPGADGGFSSYAGCKLFAQLPISQKTKDGLKVKYTEMSEIQRASLPHSICGRDILGAAKTGSGKTLAFIIPVIEKLYRLRWGSEDGVGALIISPTKDLAVQLFEELKRVGKYHNLSAGLLVGGRDVNSEKQRVNNLNIIICTPGRLLQHMDETPNFDCSNLQILVLDEADRILDKGFKPQMDAILQQLPLRQTLLFSATQTKSVKDLARVSLTEPEYLSVHAESVNATPERLKQLAVVIPLEQKLDVLWSFIRQHLKSKILVFLSTCKQVRYVFETFSKLRPGIPLKHLHGGMSPTKRMLTCASFAETTSVLFSTDVASRGLDFPKVDWVIQVDCPEDIETYIHRVGRTARFTNEGKSVLFLTPSEEIMLDKLHGNEPKIPIKRINPNKQKLEQISHRLASVLVQYPDIQYLAKRAFITYLRSIEFSKDKSIFDVTKLPLDEFAASLGLAVTPKVRFVKRKGKNGKMSGGTVLVKEEEEEDLEEDLLVPKEESKERIEEMKDEELPFKLLKRKRLKINPFRPIGNNKVKFDDDCNALPPLASIADFKAIDDDNDLDQTKVEERFAKLREEMNINDKEDKLIQRQKKQEKKNKQKMKIKKWREEEAINDDESDSDSDEERESEASRRKKKVYFDESENEDEREGKRRVTEDKVSLAEQEALALKLLSSMH
ncbi:hypothetical protein LUZ60_010765 [Juncus effusus]|nr:hypothetical protein LUZ60_010765 [Juncus effusus]